MKNKKYYGTFEHEFTLKGLFIEVYGECQGELVDNGIGMYEFWGEHHRHEQWEVEPTEWQANEIIINDESYFHAHLSVYYPNIAKAIEDVMYEGIENGDIDLAWNEPDGDYYEE